MTKARSTPTSKTAAAGSSTEPPVGSPASPRRAAGASPAGDAATPSESSSESSQPTEVEEEAAAIDPRDPDAGDQVEELVRAANHGADPGVVLEEAGERATGSSVESAMCDVEFRFAGEGREVAVAGDFNAWSTRAHLLQRTDEGFRLTVPLERGRRYRYRFVVDEQWRDDPDAAEFEWNDHGDRNAVIST